MKTSHIVNLRPLCRAFCTALVGIAALLATPRLATAQIYVSEQEGTVGEYDATTGTAIDANFITGLSGSEGIALSGNDLFVGNGSNRISEYNATTGAVISANFITGLNDPAGIVVSGNNLYVTNNYAGSTWVGEYNATTGATINAD